MARQEGMGWDGRMDAWKVSDFRRFCWIVWEKSDICLSSGDSLQPCDGFKMPKSLDEIAKLTLETGIT